MQRKATRQILGGWTRAKYGCIVSFENADGKTLVVHREGHMRTSLVDCLETALALDPTFRVVSYSTPQTIYGDLNGARDEMLTGAVSATLSDAHKYRSTTLPEASLLGRIGCLSMLHPRLISTGGRDMARKKQAERDPLEAVQAARERVS